MRSWMYSTMRSKDERRVTVGFGAQLATLLLHADSAIVVIVAVVFALLLPFLSNSTDLTGPLLGVSGTLAALSIPAAGLAGPAAEQDRAFWEQVWKVPSKEFTKERIDAQLAAMVKRLKGLWRALMWIYLSLPFAAIAAARPRIAGVVPIQDLTIDPSAASWFQSREVTLDVWQISAAICLGLIVTAVVRLIPPTWQLLHIQSIEAVRAAVWNAPREEVK